MPITVLDGLLIAIMLVSAILAMIRGFVREVLSIVSWVVAAFAAYKLYGLVLPYIEPYIPNQYIALAVAAGAVFLITLIIVSYITMRFSDFILDSRIGALDRTVGFVFGAVRGFLLVVVAMLFFNWFVPEPQQPVWIAGAKSKPILNSVGQELVGLLPEDPESTILDRIRGNSGGSNDSADAGNQDENSGYSNTERDGLSQLTTSSDN